MKYLAVLFLSLLAGFTPILHAEEWPKGFVTHEGSISPDKRFGILIPDVDSIGNDENPGEVNYLANLKTHSILGTIDDARYWEHGNHVGLTVQWAPDGSVCAAIYRSRFGLHSLSLLLVQRDGTTFRQVKLAKTIQDHLDQVIRQTSKDTVTECEVTLATQIDGSRLSIRALGQNNPKALDKITTFLAYFHGTYDIKSEKWTDASAQPLTISQYGAMEAALLNLGDYEYSSLESEADHLDHTLNRVYQAARFALPAERFTQVKLGQIAWLKERDSIRDFIVRNRYVEARIKALRELIW